MEAGARGSGRSGRRTDRTAPSATWGCCSCACSLEDDKTADQKMRQNKVTTINNSIYFLLGGISTLQQKDCREISGWTGPYDLVANEPWWDSDFSQALVNGDPSLILDPCFLSDMMWVKAMQEEGGCHHSSFISLSFVSVTPAWAWFGHAGIVVWLKAEQRA